jgi:DNA repair protein RecO (recombination protein O)
MNWSDSGYLLSKNRYNENSIIAEIFTENHGKSTGIIFGASSKKIKNYLEIGNNLHINYNSKNEGRIGYFKVEILNATTPLYFDDRKKLMCIASAMNLVKLVTVEAQESSSIYYLIDNFFKILATENWTKKYIFWELELLRLIGFHLELNKIVNEKIIDNKKEYFVQNSFEKKVVPNFLIDINDEKIDKVNLLKGLKLVGDYLEKNILKPNNINYPTSRLDFINILK